MGEIPHQERLRLLAGAVHNSANIGMWCFGLKYDLIYSTCPHEKEFLMFLELGGAMDFVRSLENGCDRPVVLSDSRGLVWVAEHTYENGKPCLLIVMGPVFLSSNSAQNLEDALRKMDFSIYVRKQMMHIMESVPVVMLSMLNQYAVMLHYMITEEQVHPGDFIYQNQEETDREGAGEGAEEADPERMAKGEQMILQAIREGNLNYMQVMEDEGDFGGGFASRTGDSLRDAKNTVIIFLALCSRAALEGGIPAKTAREIESRYLAKIENCDTLTRLSAVNIEMMQECVQRVHKCRVNPDVSSAVQECCDYIRANVLRPLSVGAIARELGYTEYYFTKKFYREMGVRMTDYIKEARIEYAKIALITTKKSIQEISDSLHFGTRNYFSKVFHDIVGITPAVYRERMGREDTEK